MPVCLDATDHTSERPVLPLPGARAVVGPYQGNPTMTTTRRAAAAVFSASPTMEGADVRLHRVFGNSHERDFDPFLMLDDFRAERREDFIAGFPWHPHRGLTDCDIPTLTTAEGAGEFAPDAPLVNREVVLLGEGDHVSIQTAEYPVSFLLLSGRALREPIAWRGPIVMNTDQELRTAFREHHEGYIREGGRGALSASRATMPGRRKGPGVGTPRPCRMQLPRRRYIGWHLRHTAAPPFAPPDFM